MDLKHVDGQAGHSIKPFMACLAFEMLCFLVRDKNFFAFKISVTIPRNFGSKRREKIEKKNSQFYFFG
jgi:hypothetical protein